MIRNPQSAIRYPHVRAGVTVLEVLISIGVASVGLLGVILLIPLADHQMNRGLILERSNQVGGNAFREFQIWGMNNPDNWRVYGGPANPPVTNPPVGRPALMGIDPGSGQREFRRAFCLDPRFVAGNFDAVNNQLLFGPNNEDPRLFPYVVDGTVTILNMPRISLPSSTGVMRLAQADTIFVSRDDLDFRRPATDLTLPPVQVNNEGNDWDPAAASPLDTERVRKAHGRLSWMATIVPHEKVGPNGDEYVLSVVVFHNRDASFAMTPVADEPANERVAQVPVTGSYNGFIAGGVGGGAVAIMPRDVTRAYTQDEAERELAVRAGNWVLLSRRNRYFKGNDNNGNPVFGDAPQSHRWYRVVSADSEVVDSNAVTNAPPNSWVRFATLDGPDWPADAATQVTLVNNVAAVFEKTIRLETSSLWTD